MSSMYKQFAFVVAGVFALSLVVGGYFLFSAPTEQPAIVDTSYDAVPDSLSEMPQTQQSGASVPQPQYQTRGCTWEWFVIRDVGVWAERCTFNSTEWYLRAQHDAGLVLMIGNKMERRALQLFQKPRTRPIESIINQIAEGAPAECVMQKNDIQSGPGRLVYEFVPTGALKRSFEKSTEVPPDPCGSYGISASGQRLFEVWEGHEDTVIFLDYGPDGSLFEYETLTFIR